MSVWVIHFRQPKFDIIFKAPPVKTFKDKQLSVIVIIEYKELQKQVSYLSESI